MSKSALLSAAVFLLVVIGQNLSPLHVLAKVTGDICIPGNSQTKSCTIDGCSGKQTRICNALGTGWGTWSPCSKDNPSCTTGGGSGGGNCTIGNTLPCSIDGCVGKQTCIATGGGTGSAYTLCVKNVPSCGVNQSACKTCGGAGGLVCINSATSGCQSSYNTCENNLDCGGVIYCSATNPCPFGMKCDNSGKCIDPAGPISCGFTEDKYCTQQVMGNVSKVVTEPGGTPYCDATGHWCTQVRVECKTGNAPDERWCIMRLETQCTPNVDPRCVGGTGSTPTPTPTTRPSVAPSASPKVTPSPSPSPIVAASCRMIVMYTTAWKPLTDFSTFKTGNQFYMCTYGSANTGEFTKARFTVNAELRAETTLKMPGTTNYFCDLYTVPATTYDFVVTSEVYHSILGWRQ